MKWIIKKAVTPIKEITGSIIDSKDIADKTTNTYSAEIIDNEIGERIQAFHNTKKVCLGCDYLGQKDNTFNLNNLKEGECCWYASGSLPTNYPATAPGVNYMVYCFKNITDYGSVQFAFSDGNNQDTNIYMRTRWGTEWRAWRKITTS